MAFEYKTPPCDEDVHVSRPNAGIPLMLQHYWWSEECFIDAGMKDKITSIRGNFYMNHLLKNELDSIKARRAFPFRFPSPFLAGRAARLHSTPPLYGGIWFFFKF